jgi:DNA repair ATPase RecN
MESLNAQLRAVKEKFPEQSNRIEELYEMDEDFRTLCHDYVLCMRQLMEIKKQFSEKQHYMKEYKYIRKELEKELHDFIFSG